MKGNYSNIYFFEIALEGSSKDASYDVHNDREANVCQYDTCGNVSLPFMKRQMISKKNGNGKINYIHFYGAFNL